MWFANEDVGMTLADWRDICKHSLATLTGRHIRRVRRRGRDEGVAFASMGSLLAFRRLAEVDITLSAIDAMFGWIL